MGKGTQLMIDPGLEMTDGKSYRMKLVVSLHYFSTHHPLRVEK